MPGDFIMVLLLSALAFFLWPAIRLMFLKKEDTILLIFQGASINNSISPVFLTVLNILFMPPLCRTQLILTTILKTPTGEISTFHNFMQEYF